jgi:hypothetical protein
MNKNPFILLLLLLSSCSHAQKITLGIPPVYTVEVDTSEWSVLFWQPEAMMLYNGGMPQELVHKKTGFIISLKAGYLLDINGIQWLNKMIEKDPSVHTSNENPINRAFLKDPLASQRSLLFGNIKPLPQQSLPPFDAYQKSDATLNIASSFLWMVDTHFINLYTQQTPNETELKWLKEILASVRTTSTQEMDSMAHYPLLNPDTIALKSQRRHMLENSHSMLAKQLLLPENDHLLLSDLSFQFTFTSMHQSLVRFVEHEISMTELLPLHKKWNPENANPYVNYHIPLHKKDILLTQIYMEKIFELFPRSIHKIEPIYPTTIDKVEYYEGYNDSVYYLLQMDLRKAQWTNHLDSMRFDHWINQEGKIERQKHESNRFSGPIRMKRLEGNTDDFCAHTTRTFRVKNEIHRSFDDHYFYRHSSQGSHLFPFRTPSKTAAYESFVLYEIDEPDQKIIDRFFASNDTMRYYTGADMHDESPNMVMYRGTKKMEYQSVPQKRLYGTSIFTTDLNHNQALEYWQFYVCNGKVIQTNFYSTFEADDSLKKQQKKVLKLPVLQKLISTSTSTGINNHQMLFHSNGSFENEFIQEIAVEAEDGALREDRSILMERDTTVYQYPTRQAIFMPMDPEGIQFMESHLRHTPFSQLPTHTHYKVSFIIEKDGSLSHLSVRCIGGRPVMAVEDKLFDIVRAMPNWQSATYDGYPVRSYGSLYFGLYLKNKK